MKLINSDFTKCGGIYKITNIINGKCYIGRTNCFYRRCSQYRTGYKKNSVKYINDYMLNSMKKYGFDNFVFRVIEICEKDVMYERETFWMNYYNSHDSRYGYNLRKDALGGQMITHPDTSKKITERLKLEWSEGIRANHGDKLKKSWEIRDKEFQSNVMTKVLTKWIYLVDDERMSYRQLKDKSLHGVLGKFAKYKCNQVLFKDRIIERVSIDGS